VELGGADPLVLGSLSGDGPPGPASRRYVIPHRRLGEIATPKTTTARPPVGDGPFSADATQSPSYLWPPPAEPCPLEALPADEDVLVPDETAAVEEETELEEVDIAPEYPAELCDIPA
jgi:hypothetical protein